MKNNNFASKNRSPQLVAIIVFCGVLLPLVLVSCSPTYPKLTHYFVTVASAAPHEDLQKARLELQDSIFRSVNALISQNQNLSYSQALDQILPIRTLASNSLGGIVVVIKNNGSGFAHNIQVTIKVGVPLEKPQVSAKGNVTVFDQDSQNGTLRVSVDSLAPQNEVQIVVRFTKNYEVFLTASRTQDLYPPTVTMTDYDATQQVQILATQTAVAIYNRDNIDGLLQFHTEYAIDDIHPIISVSSREQESRLLEYFGDKEEESRLFFEAFHP